MSAEMRECNEERKFHKVQRAAEIEAGLEGCFWILPAKELAEKLETYNRVMREHERKEGADHGRFD